MGTFRVVERVLLEAKSVGISKDLTLQTTTLHDWSGFNLPQNSPIPHAHSYTRRCSAFAEHLVLTSHTEAAMWLCMHFKVWLKHPILIFFLCVGETFFFVGSLPTRVFFSLTSRLVFNLGCLRCLWDMNVNQKMILVVSTVVFGLYIYIFKKKTSHIAYLVSDFLTLEVKYAHSNRLHKPI